MNLAFTWCLSCGAFTCPKSTPNVFSFQNKISEFGNNEPSLDSLTKILQCTCYGPYRASVIKSAHLASLLSIIKEQGQLSQRDFWGSVTVVWEEEACLRLLVIRQILKTNLQGRGTYNLPGFQSGLLNSEQLVCFPSQWSLILVSHMSESCEQLFINQNCPRHHSKPANSNLICWV